MKCRTCNSELTVVPHLHYLALECSNPNCRASVYYWRIQNEAKQESQMGSSPQGQD
jgi:hypothetical protein